MDNTNSYDSKLSQARGLASQLGMFAEENDMYSYFVSAKTGDMVSSSFFRIAADLAGVVLTKPEMDVAVKPIQAAIVDYQRDDETENRPAKVHDRGGKSGCMLQ